MSLTSPVPNANGIAHTALGQPCFLCGKILGDPAIFWMGATAEIYLHPLCVMPLFVCLGRDVHEWSNPDYYRRRALELQP